MMDDVAQLKVLQQPYHNPHPVRNTNKTLFKWVKSWIIIRTEKAWNHLTFGLFKNQLKRPNTTGINSSQTKLEASNWWYAMVKTNALWVTQSNGWKQSSDEVVITLSYACHRCTKTVLARLLLKQLWHLPASMTLPTRRTKKKKTQLFQWEESKLSISVTTEQF